MKLVFERETYAEILHDLRDVLAAGSVVIEVGAAVATTHDAPNGAPVTSGDNRAPASPDRGVQNDVASSPEGSSPDALPEGAASTAKRNPKTPKPSPKPSAKTKPAKKPAVEPEPEQEDAAQTEDGEADVLDARAEEADAEEERANGTTKALTPADIIKIKAKTIEALQAAYSGGKQKQVFAILSKYGNGAKSFRELSMDAFLPISEAIERGELA